MPNYVLNYFDGRGRAEVIRTLFHAGNISFTDNRVKDWPAGKPNAPLGQLPYLEVDGVALPQSASIARYVAREANLAGRTNLEQAQADAVVDTCVDYLNAFYQKVFSAENKEEAKKEFHEQKASIHLGNLDKLISLYGKNGFAVGDELTWADVEVFEILDQLKVASTAEFDLKYPNLSRNYHNTEKHPKLSSYYSSRPASQF